MVRRHCAAGPLLLILPRCPARGALACSSPKCSSKSRRTPCSADSRHSRTQTGQDHHPAVPWRRGISKAVAKGQIVANLVA